MYCFEKLPTPFFGNVGFIKFGTFSALLALPVMIREEYGQTAHQAIPNILLSNASLVTKSYIARFVDDDAFNPSALSDCSTGPSPPLAHGKSTLSPSHPNAGCPQPGLFGRFRSISEQTAHRSRKIRAQCERPSIGRLIVGRGAAVPAPARTVSDNVSYCRGPVSGKKQQTFYKYTQKCIISIPPRDTKPEFRGHGKVVFHIALEFSDCDEPLVWKSSENAK